MSGKASKTLIGVFVLGAVALLVAAVLLFGSGKLFSTTRTYILYFDRSVAGLSVGSAVTFRGVKIGSVKDIRLEIDPQTLDFSIPVLVEIMPEQIGIKQLADDDLPDLKYDEALARLIEKGLRAVLQQQSFVTGQLTITLDYHPEKPAVFRGDGNVAEIPTVPSTIEEIANTLEKLPLNELVSSITGAVKGIQEFFQSPRMKELPEHAADMLAEAKALMQDVRAKVDPITSQMNATLVSYGELAKRVDDQVDPLAGNMAKTLDAYRQLAAEAGKGLRPLEGALTQAHDSLAKMEQVVDPRSPTMDELRRTLQEISGMAKSIKQLADYLERHPEALLRGK
ncbi:MlaD family protein [Megalodesulfovibrio paquesii]